MRLAIAIAGILLLYSPLASGKAQDNAPGLNQPVVFPGHVEASPGLVYETLGGFRPLTLDLYQRPPRPKEAPRPAILFVHGGDWMTGDARHAGPFDDFPSVLAQLAAQGYVVASVNYRLAAEAHFPAAVRDVKEAIRWLRAHAADYDLDGTRVMAWGLEAGGQIAALVGTSCGVNSLEPETDAKRKGALPSDCVEGVIDWAGPVDLLGWEEDGEIAGGPTPLGAYLGCEPADCAPGVVRAASPLSYLDSMTPPFLIQQGAADTHVPPSQSLKFHDALQALNVPSELITYPGVGENFSRGGLADRQVDVKLIADMEDFIAKTFPPAPLVAPARPPARAPQPERKRRGRRP
ncbi:MAG: alpha/beta hydrolase fold domain-containing protein [Rhizomicrobium sp.]